MEPLSEDRLFEIFFGVHAILLNNEDQFNEIIGNVTLPSESGDFSGDFSNRIRIPGGLQGAEFRNMFPSNFTQNDMFRFTNVIPLSIENNGDVTIPSELLDENGKFIIPDDFSGDFSDVTVPNATVSNVTVPPIPPIRFTIPPLPTNPPLQTVPPIPPLQTVPPIPPLQTVPPILPDELSNFDNLNENEDISETKRKLIDSINESNMQSTNKKLLIEFINDPVDYQIKKKNY